MPAEPPRTDPLAAVPRPHLEGCLVVGYYGGGNYGDELLLEVVLSRLRAAGVRDARFIYQNPAQYAVFHRDFGYRMVGATDLVAMLNALLAARCLVVGGGGLWGRDITWRGLVLGAALFAARRLLRKPTYLLGVGYYRSTGLLGHLSACLAGWGATQVLARDAESFANFRRVTRRVRLDTDLARYVTAADLRRYEREAQRIDALVGLPDGTPAVLVGLRRFACTGGQDFLASVERLVRDHPDRHFVLATLQPQAVNARDHATALRLKARYPNVSVIDLAFNPLAFLAWLHRRRTQLVMIAPQYHALVSAVLTGIPLFPMAYDNKVEQLLTELGYAAPVSFYEVRSEDLSEFVARGTAAPAPVRARRGTPGQRVLMAAIKLARLAIANTPAQRLRVVSWLYRRTVLLAWGATDLTADFRGLRLTVQGGNHIFVAGLLGGFYESIELDILQRLAARSHAILDIGANIGTHTCVAAASLPPGGYLVAFEPVPDNLALLRHNIDQNGLADRVRVECLAVGQVPGEQPMHLVAEPGNHSLSPRVAAASRASVPVRVTSLDAYLGQSTADSPIDLVKVDIEGYDGYALRGADRLLREHRPTLMAEFVPRHLADAGFPPAEFLDIVFGWYPHVFVIDEPRRRLRRCSRGDLDRYADKAVNLNLVATARPDHLRVIEAARPDRRHGGDVRPGVELHGPRRGSSCDWRRSTPFLRFGFAAPVAQRRG